MVCDVSKWVFAVYLRSVSCSQWCVMLVSGVGVVDVSKWGPCCLSC